MRKSNSFHMEVLKDLIEIAKKVMESIEMKKIMIETSDEKLIGMDEDVKKAEELVRNVAVKIMEFCSYFTKLQLQFCKKNPKPKDKEMNLLLAIKKGLQIWEEVIKAHDEMTVIIEKLEDMGKIQMNEKALKRKYERELKKKCSKITELEDRMIKESQINDEHERELKKKCIKIKELEDRMRKEGQINDELQEARQELIRGLGDYTGDGSTTIGLKKLGATDLSELWNFEQGREATLKEVITYIIHQNKKLKTFVDIFC